MALLNLKTREGGEGGQHSEITCIPMQQWMTPPRENDAMCRMQCHQHCHRAAAVINESSNCDICSPPSMLFTRHRNEVCSAF